MEVFYGPPSAPPNAKPFADNRSQDETTVIKAKINLILYNFRLNHHY